MTTTDNSLEQAWSRDTVDRQVRDRMAQTVFKATGDLDRGMLGRMDRVSLVPSLARMSVFWALNPAKAFEDAPRYWERAFQASLAAWARSAGATVAGPFETGKDRRFADPAWA